MCNECFPVAKNLDRCFIMIEKDSPKYYLYLNNMSHLFVTCMYVYMIILINECVAIFYIYWVWSTLFSSFSYSSLPYKNGSSCTFELIFIASSCFWDVLIYQDKPKLIGKLNYWTSLSRTRVAKMAEAPMVNELAELSTTSLLFMRTLSMTWM